MHLGRLRYKTGKNSSESVAQIQTTTVEGLTKNLAKQMFATRKVGKYQS